MFSQSIFQARLNPVESLKTTVQREINLNHKVFTAYGEDYVAVNNERFSQPIVVTSDEVFTNWGAQSFATLTTAHFDYFLSLAPEVLLLGTGSRQHFAEPALFRNLIKAGIGIEFMDTHAACRTYNILVAEERKVVAAILF